MHTAVLLLDSTSKASNWYITSPITSSRENLHVRTAMMTMQAADSKGAGRWGG